MSTSDRGIFISFEGIDGCGKSTQVNLLMERLEKSNINSTLVREPGGTDISEDIRSILLNNRNSMLSSRSEALLMTASRAQLTKERIIPAIEAGICVIADRYKDSTLAYQGGGRGLDMDYLIGLNDFATYDIDPDLTFFLDIDPELAFSRSNPNNADRIESAGVQLQESVRNGYREIAKRFPDRFFTINGEESISVIHGSIWENTINCINEKN